jgi:TPR repeat protein
MYARGDGVERDRNEAAAWFRRAAEQGSVRAKEYLKRLNENSSATL